MRRTKRRHSIGFGYIGFGNNQSVFNQTSNKAFSTLKDKLDKESHYHFQLHFSHHKLTRAQREIIKNNIRKNEQLKNQKAFAIFCIVVIILGYVIKWIIDNFVSQPLY